MRVLKYINQTFQKKGIDFLIFFITSVCNARCKHCFYADSLNKPNSDLTDEEIRKVIKNLGPIKDIAFSGGEPTLRSNIVEITKQFYDDCGSRSFSLPCNGLLPDRIRQVAEQILEQCPEAKLLVNFSIDGLNEIHDRIRAVPGNFKRSLQSIEKLIELRDSKYLKRLFVNVNTVITNENYKEMPDQLKFFREKYDLDGHFIEVMRGTPKDPLMGLPSIEEIKKIHKLGIENDKYYANRKYDRGKFGADLGRYLTTTLVVGAINYLYYTQERVLEGKKWKMDCKAGETSAVIDANGDVRICELRERIANLRDHDYNMHNILKLPKSQQQINLAKSHACDCTHNCFIYNSINHTPKVRMLDLPIKAIKINSK
ncbi:MAG: radical SAM protein [Candidatus Pacearchaeota archaeon]|nr:radical SAM protein [Candidatus Pacearchaeota archaeon]